MEPSTYEDVCVAILLKDKAYCLNLYLECLYKQTFPKKHIHLYVRTNDNKDNSAEIMKEWLDKHGEEYASVWYDDSDIDSTIKKYGEHEWNSHRFSILAAIRQQSCDYAKEKGLHYFVADCDNFLMPDTLKLLYQVRALGLVGPHLDTTVRATNVHHCADPNGYYKECAEYDAVRFKKIRGLIECDVVHCTYFIPKWVLPFVCYDDGSGRYEYVIIADKLRKSGIRQYYDSRVNNGFLIQNEWTGGFEKEIFGTWVHQYPMMFL